VPGPDIDNYIATVSSSGAIKFYHTDKMGSIVAMSDVNGNLAEGPYVYDAYGNCFSSGAACSAGVGFRYTGQRLDPETGLYYYRARYYQPGIGQFLQTDPVGYKDNLNLYAYVGDDPTDRTDPSGLISAMGAEEAYTFAKGNQIACGGDQACADKVATVNVEGGAAIEIGGLAAVGCVAGGCEAGLAVGGRIIVKAAKAPSTFSKIRKILGLIKQLHDPTVPPPEYPPPPPPPGITSGEPPTPPSASNFTQMGAGLGAGTSGTTSAKASNSGSTSGKGGSNAPDYRHSGDMRGTAHLCTGSHIATIGSCPG
jgi:RHS repeat-associated protein